MPKKKKIDPATKVNKTTLNRTLAEVNKILAANGKPTLQRMPDGVPRDSCKCPIAIALKPVGVVEVEGSVIEFTRPKSYAPLGLRDIEQRKTGQCFGPKIFDHFVDQFDDRGEYGRNY